MTRITIILAFLGFFPLAVVAVGQTAASTLQTLKIGDTSTKLEVTRSGPGITYIHLHQDEVASYKAAKTALTKTGGSLIAVKHHGNRLLDFKLAGKTYLFDPNRIFSDTGIKKSLRKYGPYSEAAFKAVKNYRETILNLIKNEKMIVAMHNNYNKNFSLRNYQKNGDSANTVKDIHVNKKLGDGNFYYVTENKIFQALKNKNQNVVLQNNAKLTDNGFLAEYAAQHKIAYVNIEAQRKYYTQQLGMIEILNGM